MLIINACYAMAEKSSEVRKCDDYRGFALSRCTPAYYLPPLTGLLIGDN